MQHVFDQLCRYTKTVYIFTSGLLITRLSPQSAGATQAVQGAVGRENPGLARGAQINAEVRDKYFDVYYFLWQKLQNLLLTSEKYNTPLLNSVRSLVLQLQPCLVWNDLQLCLLTLDRYCCILISLLTLGLLFSSSSSSSFFFFFVFFFLFSQININLILSKVK